MRRYNVMLRTHSHEETEDKTTRGHNYPTHFSSYTQRRTNYRIISFVLFWRPYDSIYPKRSALFATMDHLRTQHIKMAPMINQDWSQVQLVTFATEPNQDFCKMVFSSLANGYAPMQVIHMNQSLTHGNGEKIFQYQKFLSEAYYSEDIPLLLFDAFDVWFQLPEPYLRMRFSQYESDLVVGADKYCWPNKPSSRVCLEWPQSALHEKVYGDYTDMPFTKTNEGYWQGALEYARPRWLNSGTLIGTRVRLSNLFTGASHEARDRLGSFHDQEVLANVLINDDKFWAADSRSNLFQTLTYSHQDMSWEVNPDPNSPSTAAMSQVETSNQDKPLQHAFDLKLSQSTIRESFWYNRPLLRNKISNTIPSILHFNGRKEFMTWWWKRMWFSQEGIRESLLNLFNQEQNEGSAGVWNGDKWIPWSELCGNHELF